MAFDTNKLAQLGHVQDLGNRIKKELEKVSSLATDAIKHIAIDGNTIKFYTDKTPKEGATPAYTVDFPAEMVLDQAKTTFVDNFTFSTETYPGATAPDPSIDGKPVLVLAVKTTDAQGNVTLNYSFLNLNKLVDIVSIKAGDSSKVLGANNNEIEFKISAADGNTVTVKDDGIYVTNRTEGATENHVVIFDENGAPKDSGIVSDTLVLTSMIATDTESNEMLQAIFPTVQAGE